MRKLIIGKNDDPALVVEKILATNDRDLVLVVPKFSRLADSVSNFHLLKREAEADNKNILIESVDDDALALAQAAKLAGINPFLSARRKSMSDIVPPISSPKEEVQKESEPNSPPVSLPDSSSIQEVEFASPPPSRRSFFSWRWSRMSALLGGVFLFAALFIAFVTILPSVTIDIQAKTYDWQWRETVSAIVGLSETSSSDRLIPATILTETRNLSLEAPASGQNKVERKARGLVTIYNNYSSRPQPLVATTRLLTPTGKLFRLIEQVTVPGAKIEQGKIIPSSITAEIIADQPGEEYNLGPVSRFTIPGFQGSSKYEGFYAVSDKPTTGGFIGTVAFATEDDIEKAKERLTSTLRDSLSTFTFSSLPENFISDPAASKFKILNMEVNEEAGDNGNFSVFGEAEFKLIAFPKEALLDLVKEDILTNLGFSVVFRDFNLDLSEFTPDFEKNQLKFVADFSGVVARDINSNQLAEEIAGRSAPELKDFLLAQAGIEGAKISFWPFWVNEVPKNPKRVNLEVSY